MLKEILARITEWAVPLIDLMALVIIIVGTVETFFRGLSVMFTRDEGHRDVRAIWMRFSRWLVAGLTFQLAADIIETSVTPGWDDIGHIAAIAVIRTFLNYFLERDQAEVRELERQDAHEATR